jgi:hypothetical protein
MYQTTAKKPETKIDRTKKSNRLIYYEIDKYTNNIEN